MKIQLKLIKRLFRVIQQTNFNSNSEICIPLKTYVNILQIILCIDSELLEDFRIWSSTNNTILLDYHTTSYPICCFDIHKDKFSMCLRKSNGVNILVDKEKFSIEAIEKYLDEFKN